MIRRLFLLVAVLLLAGGAAAAASPTGVTFTQSATTVHVGEPVIYSGTAVCDAPPCRYQWRVFGSGYSRLGTPIGEGAEIVKAWPSVGNKLVSLKVTNSRGTNGFGTYQAYTIVSLP